MSGTPLLIRDITRLLKYYKGRGTVVFNDKNIVNKIMYAIEDYQEHYFNVKSAIRDELSFTSICQKNINLWKKWEGENH